MLDGFGGGLIARRFADIYSAMAEGAAEVPEASRPAPMSQLAEEDRAYRESAASRATASTGPSASPTRPIH